MKKKFIALILAVIMTATCVGAGVLNSPDIQLVDVESGESVSTVEIPRSERSEIAVDYDGSDLAYQWQLSSDGKTWINVYGQTEESIKLSYAMVCNMLSDDGTAQVRCIVTDADNKYESNTAEVSFVEDKAVSAVDNSAAAKPAALAVKKSAVAAQSDPAETPSTYTILINYIFTDGKQAAPSWTATIAKGSSYRQTVTSPTVVGYTPNQESVDVNVTNASKDTTYNVYYYPAEVNFTVKHYQQNLENDNYTLVDTETRKGTTATEVGGSLAKTNTGFYSLLYDTTTKIAADGSTEVKIYYDRYYFLMSFDLDGGYGVEPIYARYGAKINVDTPKKAGYEFAGWDKTLPGTMPAENSSYKATWTPGSSGFTVVFWYENADDNGYSVAGTYKPANVAPGTTVKSDDYKNVNFTGRDAEHFTYNSAKAETLTVKGDDSTVLNVYFTRNTYTLTFTNTQQTLTCKKTEHEHTPEMCCNSKHFMGIHTGYGFLGSCNTNKCPVGYEHTHDSDCYNYNLIITAKYDSDITRIWETDPIKSLLNEGYVFKSSATGKYYSFLEKMPGQNITMTKTYWSGDTYTWYYYLEVPNGMSAPSGATTRTDKGKTYYLYHTTQTRGDGLTLTYEEDYFPITGYTQRDSSVPSFSKDGTAYLYYTRNQYSLKFMNHGNDVSGKGGSYYYQQDVSGTYFVPDYPAKLEKNAYEFEGWYDNPFFNESGKFEFNGATMPASDVILYAHWVPKTHNVEIYKTSEMKAEDKIGETQVVPHGNLASKPETPTHPVSDKYEFVGWFYMSDDPTPVEKAFDFSMPVNRDLKLYAKWSSNVLVSYTIHYQLQNGTKIADDTIGSALAGATRTFDAKTGIQLNEGYQSGYFPTTPSHSLTMNIEGGNEFTFEYVPKAEVNYTVRYLEKDTNIVLHEEKQKATSDAVITEKFEQIAGYAPDAYQKRLVLSANDEENVITFWYVQDNVHAPVQIIHWTQNIAGDGYIEYQSSTNLSGVIRNKYSETPLNINGFKYNGTKSNPSGTLTAEGLVLNLYYDRIEYPYEFRFLEQGTNNPLADPEGGNARYQAQVTQSAKTIPGYKLVGSDQMSINIAIEDPADTANKNVKTFYYVEETVDIKYKVVGPEDCGTLDNYQDNGIGVISADLKGSTPTAEDGFKFVGWFKDKACTQPVSSSWVAANSKLTPGKTKDYGNRVMGYEAATYYAKFDWNVADLTITKTGAKDIDNYQSFIFRVTGGGKDMYVTVQGNGSVTIKGLTVGTYKVEEVTSWSWRYKPDQGSINVEVKGGQKNEVTFNNSRTNGSWLSGDSFAINRTGGRR